jgi:hypothetical protein
MKDFKLHENKAKLLREVISNQKSIIKNEKLIDIFVNIPIALQDVVIVVLFLLFMTKLKTKSPAYIEALLKEITYVKTLIIKNLL